jgi:hypothetical protein
VVEQGFQGARHATGHVLVSSGVIAPGRRP